MPVEIDPISVVADGSAPVAEVHGGAAVSDTGAVVAFDAATEPDLSDQRVWVRDRTAGTTTPVFEQPSAAPGISGNGCAVAYSVAGGDVANPTTSLVVADRCLSPSGTALPPGTVVDTVPGAAAPSAPGVSLDGSVIVWSTGDEIRRYVRGGTASGYELTDAFDGGASDGTPVSSDDVVTGVDPDISADGSTIAFVAGPGTTPYVPDPGDVYVWTLGTEPAGATVELLSPTTAGTPPAASSASPTLSSDGSVLLFESANTDLAAVGAGTVEVPFIVYVDRVDRSTRVLVDDASRPAVSGDGAHVAYVRGEAVRVVSDGSDRELAELASVEPLGRLSVSRYGRWVVFTSADGAELTDEIALQSAVMVWAADLRPSDDGSVVDSTTTTTNPSTVTTSTTTTTTTAPTTTTDVDSGGPSPTTTAPDSSEVVPLPPPSVPFVTEPRPPRIPSTPRRSTSRRSTSSTRSSRVPVDLPVPAPVVQPETVSFAPAIVDAGRSTAVVTLTNPASDDVLVTAVRIDPADPSPFAVVADTCSGEALGFGAACSVEVSFAPIGLGPFDGVISFDLADGTKVSASLFGEGAAEPTLDPVPAVASVGQVVTVFGSGFPAGAIVELTHSITPDVDEVTVDPDGTFAHVFVILPRTPSGPLTVDVAGQPDRFGDVTTEVLVSNRGSGSDAAAFRDGVGNPYGN